MAATSPLAGQSDSVSQGDRPHDPKTAEDFDKVIQAIRDVQTASARSDGKGYCYAWDAMHHALGGTDPASAKQAVERNERFTSEMKKTFCDVMSQFPPAYDTALQPGVSDNPDAIRVMRLLLTELVDLLVPLARKSDIDTTPVFPPPPNLLIQAAARQIPGILANIEPSPNGAVEIVAMDLAKRLQAVDHTLAAAQWAIHEAVQAGHLHPRPVEIATISTGRNVGRRSFYGEPDTRRVELSGGKTITAHIPEGQPTPFDRFNVVATPVLWAWWRSAEGRESTESHDKTHVGSIQDKTSPDEPPIDHTIVALMRVFSNGVSDERIEKAASVVDDSTLTTNDKLTKIDALIRLPATASGQQLGDLLGVKKQAIFKTEWWVINRKGEKQSEMGGRQGRLKERGKGYGLNPRKDDGSR